MTETPTSQVGATAHFVLLVASFVMLEWQQMPSPVRPVYVVAYLLVAPGYALLPSFPRGHRLLRFLLGLAVGLALATGLSTLMSEAGVWRVADAVRLTVGLVVVSLVARAWPRRATPSALDAGSGP